MAGFDAVVDGLCARWVAFVGRRPGIVLGVVAVLTAALGAYAAFNLGVNADPRELIDRDLPFQIQQQELSRTFYTLSDGILVVIDADSPTAAARAADDLAARLASRSDLFSQVDVPGGGPFFARNALLYLETDQLEDLADRLSHVQPFLAELARDQSLVGVADLLGQALAAQRDGSATGLDLAATLDRVSTVVEAATAGRRAPDPWGTAVLGGALPAEARTRVVALRRTGEGHTLAPGAPEIGAIRRAARSLGLTPARGYRVRITGEPVMNYEELGAVATQSWHVAVISAVLFAGVVILALRDARTVIALVGSLLVSLIWSNGIAAATVGDLNMISAAFNVLIVGLGGEFGIHFAMRYLEVAGGGRSRTDALVGTARSIGGSLFSSAVTTSIGFFIFLLTDFRGVAQLGLISGFGMFVSLVSTLTVLPALLAIGRPSAVRPAAEIPSWIAQIERVPIRHARGIRIAAVVLGLGGIALLPSIRFDYNVVALHDPSSEAVSTFEELLSSGSSAPWAIDTVARDLADAKDLARRLAGLPSVAEARTVVDYVPKDQDEKLESIETASYLVPTEITAGPDRSDADRRAALARLAQEAARSERANEPTVAARSEQAGDPAVAASAARLRKAIAALLAGPARDAGTPAVLVALERDLVGSLPAQVRDLQRLVATEGVSLEDLPDDLTRQMVAPDGRARVQVLPRGDVGDSHELERFVGEVREVAPEAGGLAVYTVEWGRVTWQAMLAALIGGVACMFVFLVLLWRSFWDGLLAFFPLALAAVLTCAALAVLGEPFNFANVIVLPMLIGMSIDSGVHLVHRHRAEPEEEDVLATSTARAVFFSTLTTMLAFGSLAFAPHRGISAIGKLLTIGVGLVLLCYVVVLPAVLEWDDRRRGRGARAPADPAPA
jgi:hopanoid biosynthesis associated RND transporter like protein HpnN